MSQRCEVQPGPGLVARGAGVVWIGPDCEREFAEVLVSCAQLTGAGSSGVLTAVAAHAPHTRGSFAVAVPNGSGWTALWRGDGRVHDGQREVDGRPASGSWVASGFGGHGQIAVGRPPRGAGAADGSAELAELTDLTAGVVPGGGALLILDPDEERDAARHPMGGSPSASAAAAEVDPVASKQQPESPRTGAGASGDDQGATQMWSASTPTPQLLFDDGKALTIDNDLVLGRRPEQHDLVVNGGARPVAIEDSQNVLSSAHAAVQVRGSEVYLLDLGSLNGTHIASASATEWTRLDSGVARRLEEGDRLLLGWTIITFALGPQA
ncbi:MAG: FHA domain-containing protein [Geodermatophilaceae bacterium]|nr:FHA domain-containing protein [Geodermatophilaceae bacterium]MDQ3477127.1 FHA domain-containing protein [Actinomycetota bacterium]